MDGTATSTFTQTSGTPFSDATIIWDDSGSFWTFSWGSVGYFTNASPVGTWTSSDPATASFVLITTTP
jgi:hypothetical protein